MITTATVADLDAVTTLACKLWPDEDRSTLRQDFATLIDNNAHGILVYRRENTVIGFIHISLRNDYVEGSTTSPVGYIEGIYVEEAFRLQRVGHELIRGAEAWARKRGCIEIGSDVELHNAASQDFHKQVGFIESNRVVMYIKTIE